MCGLGLLGLVLTCFGRGFGLFGFGLLGSVVFCFGLFILSFASFAKACETQVLGLGDFVMNFGLAEAIFGLMGCVFDVFGGAFCGVVFGVLNLLE